MVIVPTWGILPRAGERGGARCSSCVIERLSGPAERNGASATGCGVNFATGIGAAPSSPSSTTWLRVTPGAVSSARR
jgi:hypothetical protein